MVKHEVQSIIFKKNAFTKEKAEDWIREHGYKNNGVDEKVKTLRYRQIQPNQSKYKYRVKKLTPEIEFILQFPKSEVYKK